MMSSLLNSTINLFSTLILLSYRADSRFPPSQWERALLCNKISHWLCANLESAPSYGTQELHPNHTILRECVINTLRPRQNGCHFTDNMLKCIFLNEDIWISNKIPLKFVPRDPINNIPALVQIMAWRRPGDKPLSEPMVVSSLTHICVTRPQWVNAPESSSWWWSILWGLGILASIIIHVNRLTHWSLGYVVVILKV